jgi:hypothetical protein
VVGHDSIIPPGREGKVTQEVNLASGHSGVLQKYITVFSNAKNTPELRLSLKCTILAELDVDPKYLSLKPDKKGMIQQTLSLTTQKKDLAVLDVTFLENSKPAENANNWQAALPIRFAYKLAKNPAPLADGYLKYQLDISLTAQDSTALYGNFTIKTNHPKKSELTLSGTILERDK